jgi:hypothetical protein
MLLLMISLAVPPAPPGLWDMSLPFRIGVPGLAAAATEKR